MSNVSDPTPRENLQARGLHPRKRFGQNFLVDPSKVERIVEASDVGPEDTVLEVGPGTGVLTERLLATGARVVAVEIDRDLCELLRERFGEREAFELIEGDVLATKSTINPKVVDALRGEGDGRLSPFRHVANLPYNIASPLLVTLATDFPTMDRAIVMVQKEVADRLAASPGGKDYGPLSIMVQAMCAVKRLFTLPPSCFWPRPQIDSAVVELARRPEPLTRNVAALYEMVQRLFQKRRKQVGSVLGRDHALPPGVRGQMRPEELTVEQFIALTTLAV